MQPFTHSVGADGSSLLHHFQFGGEAGHWGSQLFYQSIFQLHFLLQGGQLLIHAVQETLKLCRIKVCNQEFIILNCLLAGTAERWMTNVWSWAYCSMKTHKKPQTCRTILTVKSGTSSLSWTEGIISIGWGYWIHFAVPLLHFLVSLHAVHAIWIRYVRNS